MNLIEPKKHPACQSCPLFKKGIPVADRTPLRQVGGSWSRLAVVGEMPGRAEVQEGIPFIGPSGKLLWALFAQLNAGLTEVYVTNTIRCGLPGGKKPSDGAMKEAQECCRGLLNHNLEAVGAKAAICLGKTAWKGMTGLDGIEKFRGTVVSDPDDPFVVTCTIHPAALLRTPEKRTWIELMHADCAKALRLAKGEPLWEPDIHDALDVHDLFAWLNRIRNDRTPFACDVETDGIDQITCGLLTVGLAALEPRPVAFSIPWRPQLYEGHWESLQARLCDLLDDEDQQVVFHNKPFDVPGLQRHLGVELKARRHDTLLMHHALYPGLPHDLQSVGSHFLPLEPWKSDFGSSTDAFFKRINSEDGEEAEALVRQYEDELLWYNAADAAVTIEVFDRMWKELDILGVRQVYEHDLDKCDLSMEWTWNGIGVDLEERDRLDKILVKDSKARRRALKELCGLPNQADFERDLEAINDKLNAQRKERNALRALKRKEEPVDEEHLEVLENECEQLYAARETLRKKPCVELFNPNSHDHVLAAVIQGRGLTPEKLTKSGKKLSVSKDSLWNLREDEFVGELYQYRKVSKLHTTYVKNLENYVYEDGRIRPIWKLHSTPSGRFGTKPAVQNWPGGDEVDFNMKRMLIASPGCKIVGADYAALELRVQALFAGEEDLIRAFVDGEDRHTVHAKWFFGEHFEKADKATKKLLRGRGKNVTFGKIYGAGPDTLYYQIREKRPDVKTPEEHKQLKREVAHMSAVLDNNYPNQVKWARWANEQATAAFRVYTPRLGRCRKWPMGDITPTEPPNHLIQGSAADIMDEATFRLVDNLKARGWYQTKAWIILQIHDAIYVECEEGIASQVARLVEESLYTEWTYRSPVTSKENTMVFPAEAEIGDRVSEV